MQYIYHGKFISNADPDLNENNVGSTDQHLRIKISEKSLTQRFDVSMTSFSSEKNKI